MNFLCGSSEVDGSNNFGWLQYFDVVITGRSCSPRIYTYLYLFGFIILPSVNFALYYQIMAVGPIARSRRRLRKTIDKVKQIKEI